MKGFILKTPHKIISGGLDSGITDVLISNKEFYYKLHFGGLDDTNISYTWHSVEVQPGDIFTISYQEINHPSPVIKIRDYSKSNSPTNEDNRDTLAWYYRLKQELIEEGLLTDDYQNSI